LSACCEHQRKFSRGMAANSPAEQTLDETAFQHFAPLLAASQRYAKLGGCRFRSASFDGITHDDCDDPVVGSARYHDSGARLAAKIQAAPAVNDFKVRLCAGDLGLTREMEHAHSIVMRESIRNVMISTFKALDIFPPAELAPHVDNGGGCNYEDMSATLPLIAHRLYNDQARRECNAIGEHSWVQQQANTAAFLVDFASESDVRLPPMPQMQQEILRDFAQRTDEFTQAIADQSHHKLETLLEGMGAGTAAYLLQQEVQQWWTKQQTPSTDQPEHEIEAFIEDLGVGSAGQLLKQGGQELSRLGQAVAWTAVGAIAAGAAAEVTGSLSQRGGEHHSQRGVVL